MNKLLIFVIILCTLIINSCDTMQQECDYEGYTQTSENSDLIGTLVDQNDWKDIEQTNTIIEPAFPNPASRMVKVIFTLAEEANVLIELDQCGWDERVVLGEVVLYAGSHSWNIDVSPFAGYVRIYIHVYKDDVGYTSYGDILVQN